MFALHSRRTYLYLFTFVLTLPLLHYATHKSVQNTPQIIQYILNPSTTTLPDSNNNNPIMLIRYVSLRYGIYPILLFTYIFDRTKWKTSWINTKTLATIITPIFIILLASGRILYHQVPIVRIIECLMLYNNDGGYIYVYVPILWSILFLSVFHITQRKGLKPHQALWIASIFFFSCEEVWEYAPYMVFLNLSNISIQPYTVTLYLWRSMPTILLFAYIKKFRLNKNLGLTFITLCGSVTLSILYASLPQLFDQFIWLLRTLWIITYITLAYSLRDVKSGQM